MGEAVLLFVEVERHDVVLFEVLDLALLVDQLALLILQLLLRNDPVVIYPLPLLLEIRQELLLLLPGLLQLTQLLPHRQLNTKGTTLNYSDSVSFTLFA